MKFIRRHVRFYTELFFSKTKHSIKAITNKIPPPLRAIYTLTYRKSCIGSYDSPVITPILALHPPRKKIPKTRESNPPPLQIYIGTRENAENVEWTDLFFHGWTDPGTKWKKDFMGVFPNLDLGRRGGGEIDGPDVTWPRDMLLLCSWAESPFFSFLSFLGS